MMTYWLARKAGAHSEGPYGVDQLRAMYDAGSITAEALVCAKGAKDWRPVEEVLPLPLRPVMAAPMPAVYRPAGAAVNPMAAYERSRDADRARFANRYSVVACLLVLGVTVLAAMPLQAPWALVLAPFVMLAGFILAIMMMAKGRVFRGVMMMFLALVLLPIIVIVTPAAALKVRNAAALKNPNISRAELRARQWIEDEFRHSTAEFQSLGGVVEYRDNRYRLVKIREATFVFFHEDSRVICVDKNDVVISGGTVDDFIDEMGRRDGKAKAFEIVNALIKQ